MINAPSITPRLTSLEVRKHLEGGLVIGVVAKRTYQVRDLRCVVADEQAPLVEEPVLADNGLIDHDSDRILQRRLVDVVIEGSARAPEDRGLAARGRMGSFRASVQIDDVRREIAVFGRRELLLKSNGAVAIGEPEPVAEVALSWANAYGGVDRVLLAEEGDPLIQIAASLGEDLDPEQTLFAYPRNPHGRGYLIEASAAAVAVTELPHLEDPAHPLTPHNLVRKNPLSWPLAPAPVSTAWLPYVHFPRSVQTGLPVPFFAREAVALEAFPEVVQGLLRAEALAVGAPIQRRIDIGCAQSAPPALRFPSVQPGSNIELQNFHPRQSIWRWQLPTERPRLAYRLGSGAPEELQGEIRSLFIQPDLDLVSVVWVGETVLREPISQQLLQRGEYGMTWKS